LLPGRRGRPGGPPGQLHTAGFGGLDATGRGARRASRAGIGRTSAAKLAARPARFGGATPRAALKVRFDQSAPFSAAIRCALCKPHLINAHVADLDQSDSKRDPYSANVYGSLVLMSS